MDDCIFCKIVRKDIPAKIELETDDVIAFHDIKPSAETHIIIIPKKHIPTFLDLNDDGNLLLGEMCGVVQNLIVKLKLKDGYKTIFNGGRFQFVNHLHWHLLGGKLNWEGGV
jgi:histidine triad (HIT) family protein